jgi:acyl transferase domain-containing protein
VPTCLQCGAFMQDIDPFDASAYGLSAPEAAIMDPQHRIVLEAAGEALGAAAQYHTGKPHF